MGFQTPQHELSKYIEWTTEGRIQLPDFQRSYKWDDQRIRSLLATILRGHPLGVVMLLRTGNDQVRFKPKAVEGTTIAQETEPDWLLLDGQQRLTSLTQALTGDGIVETTDDRNKRLRRKYYVDIDIALEGDDRIDDAVVSLPHDGIIRGNFGKNIEFDVSTPAKQQEHRHFPLSLLLSPDATDWLLDLGDNETFKAFNARILKPAGAYKIPAIELDTDTSKSAVATVFEKVNTGGLRLNVFELLTAKFAGDADYYAQHQTDFRLNDDWEITQKRLAAHPVLSGIENTDFLQAVTMLATHAAQTRSTGAKPVAISAKREDVLKLSLDDYLEWVEPLRDAFDWVAGFLADRHIFDRKFLPYPKQVVPLAAIRVVMGTDADLIGPRKALVRWFWCGILGELYGGAIETRFARDLEQVPRWAISSDASEAPRTVQDANFVESRLLSLRTRNAAAYKGIYSLLLDQEARDWMEDKAFDKAQHADLNTDIHHIFPRRWCEEHGIDAERRESIVNKTAISSRTNKSIGGAAPSAYLTAIERRAQISSQSLDGLLESHLVPADALRDDDFDAFFTARRERLCQLVERAMDKSVQRDVASGQPQEASDQFEPEPEDVDPEVEEIDAASA